MLVHIPAKYPNKTSNRQKADQRGNKKQKSFLHSVTNTDRFSPLPSNGMYAIMDKGTGKPFAGKGCSVLKAHGKHHICQGREHELVDAAVTLVDPAQGNKRAMVLVINRCLYASDNETLIPGHMLEWVGISCCSRQKSHGGK
jgi:hypothetical protein